MSMHECNICLLKLVKYFPLFSRYGRKIVVLISLFLEVVFVAISAVIPNLWLFLVFRFLIGVAVGGTMLCCYVLIIELCGKSFRPYASGLQEMPFLISYISLPIIAYFVREWRQLQLVTSVPWIIVIAYYWLIPESPRWLITVGRKREAIAILTHIAKRYVKILKIPMTVILNCTKYLLLY